MYKVAYIVITQTHSIFLYYITQTFISANCTNIVKASAS